jgi:hypothetical protein
VVDVVVLAKLVAQELARHLVEGHVALDVNQVVYLLALVLVQVVVLVAL